MTKAAYERIKWNFQLQRVRVYDEWAKAWQQAARTVPESLYLWDWCESFETSKPNRSKILGPARPYLLIVLKQLLTGNQIFICLRLREPRIQTPTQLCEKMWKILWVGEVYKYRRMCALVCIWRSEDSFRCWSLLLLVWTKSLWVSGFVFSCICQVSWLNCFRVFPVSSFYFSVAVQGWHMPCGIQFILVCFGHWYSIFLDFTLWVIFPSQKAVSLENFGIFFEVN